MANKPSTEMSRQMFKENNLPYSLKQFSRRSGSVWAIRFVLACSCFIVLFCSPSFEARQDKIREEIQPGAISTISNTTQQAVQSRPVNTTQQAVQPRPVNATPKEATTKKATTKEATTKEAILKEVATGFRKRIALAHDYACLIKSGGQMVCWGDEKYRVLEPVSKFTQVSLGDWHGCGLKTDRSIECWGIAGITPNESDFEAMYQETHFEINSQVPWFGKYQAVSAGDIHVCGIKTSGKLNCWKVPGIYRGSASCYEDPVGIEEFDPGPCCKPDGWDCGEASPPKGIFKQVSAGNDFTCGLNNRNRVRCWGDNSEGQCRAPRGPIVQISTHKNHACGIRKGGELVCWGKKMLSAPTPGKYQHISVGPGYGCGIKIDGKLCCWGRVTADNEREPPRVAANWSHVKIDGVFKQVSTAEGQACALDLQDQVTCFGPNGKKQVLPGKFVSLSSGESRSCAIRPDNIIFCWGHTKKKQAEMRRHQASIHGAPPEEGLRQLSVNERYACGITKEGEARCWGARGSLEMDDCRDTENDDYCIPFPKNMKPFEQIIAAKHQTCALSRAGGVACWRSNARHGYNVGGNHFGRARPPAGVFKQITGSSEHFCGLKFDGTVACWGAGEPGLTGHGNHGQATAPGGTFLQISAGYARTYGVRTDGSLSCWGACFLQKLPQGTFLQVSAGTNHVCALKADRTVVCWGHSYKEVLTAPSGTFVEIEAGYEYSCGLRMDNTITCWGNDLRPISPPANL